MQNETQQLWDKTKAFESNPDSNREKYFCTFPYPYMNGFLHIGHAFTLCKAEFMAGYQRLKGKNVIFPFSFHCTGKTTDYVNSSQNLKMSCFEVCQ